MSSKEDSEVTDEDVRILKAICAKHQIDDPVDIMGLSFMLQTAGFGRNDYTTRVLRALADIIESPISSATQSEPEEKLN